jgi:aminoglycoside 3-N-acetyltransferase
MFGMQLLAKVPKKYKSWLKARVFASRRILVKLLLAYDGQQLLKTLRALGVQLGDTVLLHSAFEEHHGFRGTVREATDVFLEAVGPGGNLMMVSLPYRSSSLAYLGQRKRFDVRKTPSMMGMLSELFRRRPEVLRSLSPTHPMLAHGPDAAWFVSGHECCPYPCGPGSPFEKLVAKDAKAVFYNTTFGTFTFFHYLEHLVSSEMPFSLYTEAPFHAPVVDASGAQSTVLTYPFAPEAMRRRKSDVLERELRQRQAFKECRLGNGSLLVVRIRETVECVRDMSQKGIYFYDLTGLPEPVAAAGWRAPDS